MSDFTALVLSLPTRNSTLRMRLWRSLKQAGCGVLRDGVYVLPSGAAHEASLGRLEAEIRSAGGFAMAFELKTRSAAQAAEIEKLFDRAGDYGPLVRRIRQAKRSLGRLGARRAGTELRRLERAVEKVAANDFFPGEGKAQVEEAVAELKAAHRAAYGGEPRASRRRGRRLEAERYQKRTWATRRQPWIDRLASAWLIRRFIDRDARFVWIARPSECPKDAVGFDFDGAEFTHVGNRVTFEVLLESFGLEADAALASMGAAVHFLDAGGVPVAGAKSLEAKLKRAREKAQSDDALLAEAMRTFDVVYAARSRRFPP